jgi:hypothetical protein
VTAGKSFGDGTILAIVAFVAVGLPRRSSDGRAGSGTLDRARALDGLPSSGDRPVVPLMRARFERWE